LIIKGAGRLVLHREHASGHVSLDWDTPTPDALWAIAKSAVDRLRPLLSPGADSGGK